MNAWEKVEAEVSEWLSGGHRKTVLLAIEDARTEDAEQLKQAERAAFKAGFLANRRYDNSWDFVIVKNDARLPLACQAFDAWQQSRQSKGDV